MVSTITFVVSLFMSIWMGSVNIARLVSGNDIPWPNFVLFSLGLVGVIAHLYGIY